MASWSAVSTPGSVPIRHDGEGMYDRSPAMTGSCDDRSPGRPTDVCFSCGKSGHWYRQCTERGSRNTRTPERQTGDGSVLEKQCRCGGGPCLVLTAHTAKNPERKFYKCPVKTPGMNCQFFEWCDLPSPSSAASDAIEFSLYPMCACGAGRAKLSFQRDGPFAGSHCFICPIKKGQGACNFLQLADHLMKDKKVSDAPGDGVVGTSNALPYGKEIDKHNGVTLLLHGESSKVVRTGDSLPYGEENYKYNGETLPIHGDSNIVLGTGDALPYGKESNKYNGETALIHGDPNKVVPGTGDALPYGKESNKYNGETPLIHGDPNKVVPGTGDALPYGKVSNRYNGETLLIHGSDGDGSFHVFPSACPQPAGGTACGEESKSTQPTVSRKLNFEEADFVLNPLKNSAGKCYKCGRPGQWVIDCLSHN